MGGVFFGSAIAARNDATIVVAVSSVPRARFSRICIGPESSRPDSKRLPADWVHATLRKPFAPDRLVELLNGVNQ